MQSCGSANSGGCAGDKNCSMLLIYFQDDLLLSSGRAVNGTKSLPLLNHELLTLYLYANISIESSSLSETISKLSCFTLEVFDESCDVHSVSQRMVEIDEEWQQIAISL